MLMDVPDAIWGILAVGLFGCIVIGDLVRWWSRRKRAADARAAEQRAREAINRLTSRTF